jgi:hypothetical protein
MPRVSATKARAKKGPEPPNPPKNAALCIEQKERANMYCVCTFAIADSLCEMKCKEGARVDAINTADAINTDAIIADTIIVTHISFVDRDRFRHGINPP